MDPVQVLSLAAVVALSVRAFKEGRSEKREQGEHHPNPSPEYLNFKVDPYAVARLRDPSLPAIARPIASIEERDAWLGKAAERRTIVTQSSPWDSWDFIQTRDGLLHEYNCSELVPVWTDQRLGEFARLGYEIRELKSQNLPVFQGIYFDEHRDRIERLWEDFPSCKLAIEEMEAGPSQLRNLVQTILGLHRLGLQVVTIPVWLLLQRDDGEFFIPHVPQIREEPFPSNLQVRMKPSLKAPPHLFGPKDEARPNPYAFQFQLGSLIWRLLSGQWPYDIEPLLLQRQEKPERVLHDFGNPLTLVLERMTSLEPEERYGDLGVALQELTGGLA